MMPCRRSLGCRLTCWDERAPSAELGTSQRTGDVQMIRRNVDRLETRVMKKGDLREEIVQSPRTTSPTTAKPKSGDDQDGLVTPHPECTPCPSPKHQLSGSQRIPPKPGTAETAPSMLQPTSGCHARVVAQRSWQGRYLHVNAHHCARFNVQGLANSSENTDWETLEHNPVCRVPLLENCDSWRLDGPTVPGPDLVVSRSALN